MKNFLQVGGAVSVPAPRAILSGGLVVVGMLAGVAQHSAATITTITNDGTTPINTLRHER